MHERGDIDVVSKEDMSLAQENDRLRREIRILKEEREILKKATYYPAGDYVVICREGSSLRAKSPSQRCKHRLSGSA